VSGRASLNGCEVFTMEQATGTRERAAARSGDDTSEGQRGGSRKVPVAPSPRRYGATRDGRLAWFRALKESVWAPIALKALGILAGMLALAGVGASSLSRSAGVPAASGVPGAAVAAGLGVLARVEPGRGWSATTAASTTAALVSAVAPSASSTPGVDAGAPPPSSGLTADGKVILNRASVDEMGLLPGVGPKRAQALVDLRTKLGGRFKRMADLLRLKGIGPKGLRKIEAKAVLDAP
jgi:competence protein ComEA